MKKLLLLIGSLLFSCVALADEYYKKPTGSYEVGFKDFQWISGKLNTDGNYQCSSENQDPFYFTPEKDTKNFKDNFNTKNQIYFCREMAARIYFPINHHEPAQRELISKTLYLNNIYAFQSLKGLPPIPDYYYTQFQNIKTFTYNFSNYNFDDDPSHILILNDKNVPKKFPVLFFSPGNGSVFQDYENTITELVSNGYVVIAYNFNFVSDPVVFEKTENTPERIVRRSSVLSDTKYQSLIMTAPDNDAIFAIKKTFEQNENNRKSFVFNLIDRNNVAFLGHSGGGNVSIYLANQYKQIEQDNKIKIRAISSLDAAGTGVFVSGSCWDTVKKSAFAIQAEPPQNQIGAPIPFLHFHTSANDYGCYLPAYYVISNTLLPDQLVVHKPNEYWVYLAPESTLTNIPSTPGLEPPFSDAVYYSNHADFAAVATWKYYKLNIISEVYDYFKNNPQPYYPVPMSLGLGYGASDPDYIIRQLNNVNIYILSFFDHYLKYKDAHKLLNCEKLAEDTILKCSKIEY